jgi:arabinose-5-phosphate isomerase
MAIGDALAIALMEARGFTAEDFAVVHPGGQLGRNLHLKISDAMHPLHRVACVSADDAIRSVVVAMTKYPLGAACVISAGNRLEGLITDGDLRRVLQFHDDLRTLRASDVMTCEPIVVDHAQRLHDALAVMEDRESQLSLVPVLQADTRECLGLLRLHDVYSARV